MGNKTEIIKPFEGFQEQFVCSNVDFAVGGGSMGGGKLNPLYTSVLTPCGWKKIGELEVGDMVCTPFSEPAKVLQIFENKNKDIYEVETFDGRKARCGLEHLWSFRTGKQLRKYLTHNDVSADLTTEDTSYLLDLLNKGKKVYLPLPYAQDFDEIPCDIDLFEMGKNIETSIPKEFLFGSVAQRTCLLAGVVAKHGLWMPYNNVKISVPCSELAKDILHICWSLGYAAVYDEKQGNIYNVFVLENLTRKGHVQIKSIKKVDKCDARCIWIDDPLHLYIIDDFLVTHNTAAAVMSVAEPCLDSKFRAVFLRNNLGDLRSGGGILDEFKKIYGSWCNVIESGDPHVDFPSGARIDVTHIADQSKDKVLQRFKGRQYDMIYFDEGTGFSWECFCAVYSRNRGVAKWTGKVRMTTNPKRNHWLRTFLDWYIGIDGYIIPERNGVVRYFYINGETVNDVVWGDTKEEVYSKCRITIDRTLARFNGRSGTSTYKDIIKSFTFYEGKMAGNKAILTNNSGYIGSVAVMGGREAQANLEGNWNVDTDEDLDAVIRNQDAEQVFLTEPCRNGDKWVTCDLADNGTDNFLCLAWDGFHAFDYLIVKQSTPRQNAEYLHDFAAQHDIADSHIIYDAVRGTYINDYIPDAIPFISNYAPRGLYARAMFNLKTECYMRLVKAIVGQYISFDDSLTNRIYDHQNIKQPITIREEFREECSVVRFKEMPSGKKCLMSKREMNSKLGKNRSMDLLDPCAMRFFPCLEFAYGEEIEKTMNTYAEDDESDENNSIFNETLYG